MKFVKIDTNEDVMFVSWGSLSKNHDASKSILVKEKESIEGVVSNIGSVGKGNTRTVTLKVKGQEKPVMIPGKTDITKKIEAGGIKVGDYIRITYKGTTKTKNNFTFFNFDVEKAVN